MMKCITAMQNPNTYFMSEQIKKGSHDCISEITSTIIKFSSAEHWVSMQGIINDQISD